MKQRTPAYWPTRIMLAVGIVATLGVLALSLVMLANQPLVDPRPMILGLSVAGLGAAAGVGLALVGLVWMLRIFFRGRRDDEPPAWRYRRR